MRTIANDNLFEGSPTVHAGSKWQRSAGVVLSSLAVLFLLFDSAGKLLQVQPVIDGLILRGARLRALLPIRRASRAM
jgi:hypothetical protein